MKRALPFVTLVAAASFGASTAQAEFAFSAYGGANFSHDSEVTVSKGPSSWSRDIAWDGVNFEMPPYWGVRGTYWLNQFDMPNLGIGIDFNHAKVKARNRPANVSTLEFTDGINYLTLNGFYRFPTETRFTPYVGAGAGLSIPHVEYQEIGGPRTFEYQLAGGVVAGMAGVDFKITDWFSVFSEYKASYSWNEADLGGGGTLSTNVLTHHLKVGLTLTLR